MRLVSFDHGNRAKWGFVSREGGTIRAVDTADAQNAGSVAEFIRRACMNGTDPTEELNRAYARAAEIIPFASVELKAPVPVPVRNIFCVGKNYIDHILEFDRKSGGAAALPEYPCFFTKSAGSVNGPFSGIPAHEDVTSELDYEAELGVVIGSGGVDIPQDRAMDHVFGYLVVNDVTARDLQKNHLQWFKGKSLDGFCPMGPWIVTKDEIADPFALKIRSRVNGEIRQDSTTASMIFGIPVLISQLSAGLTLEPCDIIATGTPSGVGMGFNPPRLLHRGDIVEAEVENIGMIRNTII